MKIIRPVTCTDAMLVSSTVPETDHAEWAAGTTYAAGTKVIKAATHRIYESVQAGNVGHDPVVAESAGWWVDVGPTNRWAMLDSKVGTKTTAATSLTLVLAPGRIDALALLQVDAETVTVEQKIGASVIYSRTVSLLDQGTIGDWYGYFFEPIKAKTDTVLTDLLPMGESTLHVTLSRATGTVSCGMLIVGMQAELGNTLASPKIGITDYSKKEVDSFGNPTLVKRTFSKRMSVRLSMPSTDVDRVASLLAEIRATPVVWIGGGNLYTSMLMYGYYRDFDVDVAFKVLSYCDLSVEGMI